MDIITDLTAEAVSYITLAQDICRYEKSTTDNISDDLPLWDSFSNLTTKKKYCLNNHTERICEVVWSGDKALKVNKRKVYHTRAIKLLSWISFYIKKDNIDIQYGDQFPGLWMSPDSWRNSIKRILYDNPEARIGLVAALQYMPVQIIYVLSLRKPDLYKQRLYQSYYYNELGIQENDTKTLLHVEKEQEELDAFWSSPYIAPGAKKQIPSISNMDKAISLLLDCSCILNCLKDKDISVPFITLLKEELDVIAASRKERLVDLTNDDINKFPFEVSESVNFDPEKRAEEMQLAGLALSGGGIRSATFNLGILQKLAELGVLPRIDYLSTVSGGGYIGAWYSSWIYREGSIKKVIDRLNIKKSGDPMGEEVRPVRWLRMFSNYLSPNSGIMSIDSWTVGITWLRNTLINQIILLLMLVTMFYFVNTVYEKWMMDVCQQKVKYRFGSILSFSSIIIITGSFLLAAGMRTFNNSFPPKNIFSIGKNKSLAYMVIMWALVSSIVVSSFLVNNYNEVSFYSKFFNMLPVGIPSFVGMLFISVIGGYHREKDRMKDNYKHYGFWLWMGIIISAVIASVIGIVLLALSWEIIYTFKNGKIAFILGPPLIMESICVAIVVRMVLLGNLFPDERREWWGRMGAYVHRCIFWWIIISASAILLPGLLKNIIPDKFEEDIFKLAGVSTWVGLVGLAVKMAYSSESSKEKNENTPGVKELFINMAPYLFMVGFLQIGASIFQTIRLTFDMLGWMQGIKYKFLIYAVTTLIFSFVTLLLSWRVGVNEFSLHDFYKNRLVRGYLAATRRRSERERTANGFTDFDKKDDLCLSLFSENYNGPYPLINATLNATIVSELDRQDRKAESFVFTPLYCGFDFNRTRSSSLMRDNVFNYGYRPTEEYSRKNGPSLGTAMAISGAAVSPNMGYHSSSPVSFLLTIFNLRLGRWIGNPRKKTWRNSDPALGIGYLLNDLIGKSDIDSNYVYLSDGGHFDNMGLYELVRRRCSYIILCDAEQDNDGCCEGLANAIRRCRIDFGVEINLDVSKITVQKNNTQLSLTHSAKGTIKYPGSKLFGTIIYIKTAVTENDGTDIREYFMKNPKFPQQSTGDQFFDEAQFESYRLLGYKSITKLSDISRVNPLTGK